MTSPDRGSCLCGAVSFEVEAFEPNGTTRTFCRHCGSSLLCSSPRADPDLVEVALGTFDDAVPVRLSAHIFVGSSARWT